MPVAEVYEVRGGEQERLDGFAEAVDFAEDGRGDYGACSRGLRHEGGGLLHYLTDVAEDEGESWRGVLVVSTVDLVLHNKLTRKVIRRLPKKDRVFWEKRRTAVWQLD